MVSWYASLPELVHIPKIIAFLGYVPFECPDDLLGRLRYFKTVKGLSYIRLGKVMGRDPEQLTDWLTERKHPCKKNLDFIRRFFLAYVNTRYNSVRTKSRAQYQCPTHVSLLMMMFGGWFRLQPFMMSSG